MTIKMPRRMLRKTTAAALILVGALALSACGNKPETRTEGETEGTYLNVGPLTYQVQISRQLNPSDLEDATYLQGIPPALRRLRPHQTWFGVFIQVVNEGSRAQLPASNFEIEDTEDKVYRPIPQSPQNPFTYHAQLLPPKDVIPHINSVAGEGVIQGSLVLFKLDLTTLDNRPLEFVVADPIGGRGRVKLDV
jgi:hypothetical protein